MINSAHNKSLKAKPILFIFFAAVILTCSCPLPPLHEVPPVAAFTADRITIEENDQVSFTDESINAPTSWNWDFGDGSTSSQQNPSHTYSTAGTYTVILTASNDFGSDTETKTNFIIVGTEPVAAFTADRTTIEKDDQVTFKDQSDNSPTSWSWSFGDGGTSNIQDPSYTYTSTGVYTVSLTVTNALGSDTKIETDYITVIEVIPPPEAEFKADTTNIREDESVSFTDQSDNSPTSWSWSFGDGVTSAYQHPTHTYTTPGVYTVSLTATNDSGSDYEEKAGYITVREVVVDIDGNIYDVVVIGNQTWMAENLKVTRYSDGTAINYIADGTSWDVLGVDDKAYCWYDNSTTNRDFYGGLYTWAAAMNGAASSDAIPSGIQGVCPDGWHLPSDAEWNEMVIFLGGANVAGGKLKEAGFAHWNSPNTGATNESGFTALPAGRRDYRGTFRDLGSYTYCWMTNAYDQKGLAIELGYGTAFIYPWDEGGDAVGYSVRCVKD